MKREGGRVVRRKERMREDGWERKNRKRTGGSERMREKRKG